LGLCPKPRGLSLIESFTLSKVECNYPEKSRQTANSTLDNIFTVTTSGILDNIFTVTTSGIQALSIFH